MSFGQTNEVKFVLPEQGNRVVHKFRILSNGEIAIDGPRGPVVLGPNDSLTVTISCLDEVPRLGRTVENRERD